MCASDLQIIHQLITQSCDFLRMLFYRWYIISSITPSSGISLLTSTLKVGSHSDYNHHSTNMSVKVHVLFTVHRDVEKFKAKALDLIKTSKVYKFNYELCSNSSQSYSSYLPFFLTFCLFLPIIFN